MWFSFDLVFFLYRLSKLPKNFIYKAIEFLQPYFKQDTYLLMDGLDENSECIDTFTLFQYMQKNNIKSYYFVNKNNKTFEKIKRITNLKNIITTDAPNKVPFVLFCYLLKVHTVVTSFTLDWLLHFEQFLYKNKSINFVFSTHGLLFMKLFVVNWFRPDKYNYFVANNELETKMMTEDAGSANWKESNIIKAGLFRLDNLYKRLDNENKEIFIMFTWRKYLNIENFFQSDYYLKISSLLNNENLLKFAKQNNIKIKLALHHHLILNLKTTRYDYFKNNNVEIVEISNISEQIPKTSLFITDFSSIAFDFMYLDIPVIFYRFDADLDEKIKEYESIDYAMSKDKYLYNCCYSEKDTVKTIIRYIQNGFILEGEFKEKNKQFFTYAPKNNICRKFVEIAEKLNEERNL